MTSVAVIDYGMGNLHSVAKALEHVAEGRHQVLVTSDAATILAADRVVLPGVGAIRDCMAEMQQLKIDQVVREVAASGRPLLGVCVGMQAMMAHSAENNGVDCIGLFDGRIGFFGDALAGEPGEYKVPHMGWNRVHQIAASHPMWHGIEQDSRFYFVHSYYLPLAQAEGVCAATTEYGFEFCSVVMRGNVFATQFHPEKSADAGLRLYANFLNWDGRA